MAKRLFSRSSTSLLFFNGFTNPVKTQIVKHIHCDTIKPEVPCKEIKIPVQWGHISAKLWGDENERPILALHGWQDNAGTWDPLAPLLSKHKSILAIDFPGHGLSSWFPPGMHYYSWELPRLILLLKEYFKWDKVSLLCHSMGSIAGLRFASSYPEEIDFYIAVDSLIADDYDLDLVARTYPKNMLNVNLAQTRLDQEPPLYTYDELAKVWHMGTRKSVSIDSAKILMKRGSKPSKKYPNKFFVSRDARLKYILFTPESKPFVETLIKKLKCPTLYFKAVDSPYASDEFSVEMREVIERNNENFECHFVPGTHHVHLNNPELIMPHISQFLKKHNFLPS
ncbi:probable serine hydrolase [Plodia interpunctella]|uniref:probable serine hydrolase n=1 Tax=Plodia interpunctella TaxID=58824 RepID=UPI0023686E6B|nr:probable serine hydrolase [Plodia interpunctella]XP_053626081.1 probable serine hydrolase [Plodia interpunctella]